MSVAIIGRWGVPACGLRERTSAGLAATRTERRIGGRRKKLGDTKWRRISGIVVSGRKSAADMARIDRASQPTVSRIVADDRSEGLGHFV